MQVWLPAEYKKSTHGAFSNAILIDLHRIFHPNFGDKRFVANNNKITQEWHCKDGTYSSPEPFSLVPKLGSGLDDERERSDSPLRELLFYYYLFYIII
jgi:hypothetical protein